MRNFKRKVKTKEVQMSAAQPLPIGFFCFFWKLPPWALPRYKKVKTLWTQKTISSYQPTISGGRSPHERAGAAVRLRPPLGGGPWSLRGDLPLVAELQRFLEMKTSVLLEIKNDKGYKVCCFVVFSEIAFLPLGKTSLFKNLGGWIDESISSMV